MHKQAPPLHLRLAFSADQPFSQPAQQSARVPITVWERSVNEIPLMDKKTLGALATLNTATYLTLAARRPAAYAIDQASHLDQTGNDEQCAARLTEMIKSLFAPETAAIYSDEDKPDILASWIARIAQLDEQDRKPAFECALDACARLPKPNRAGLFLELAQQLDSMPRLYGGDEDRKNAADALDAAAAAALAEPEMQAWRLACSVIRIAEATDPRHRCADFSSAVSKCAKLAPAQRTPVVFELVKLLALLMAPWNVHAKPLEELKAMIAALPDTERAHALLLMMDRITPAFRKPSPAPYHVGQTEFSSSPVRPLPWDLCEWMMKQIAGLPIDDRAGLGNKMLELLRASGERISTRIVRILTDLAEREFPHDRVEMLGSLAASFFADAEEGHAMLLDACARVPDADLRERLLRGLPNSTTAVASGKPPAD